MPLTEPEPPITVPVPAKTRCFASVLLAHGEALAHDRVVDERVFVAGGDERLGVLLGRRAALEQQHARVPGQLGGDDAPGRSATDDDVVVCDGHLRERRRVRPRHFCARPFP